MIARFRRLWTLVPLTLAGCLHLPAKVCLTPPYDAPAGFSETYHAALARREPVLRPDGVVLPSGGTVVGEPVLIWPGAATTVEPPLEW
ncbi:MAG TPA: hypothetical protein VF170_05015 [Planctomycetaceae bacterium]